jgi:hypothetical protein
MAPDSKIRAGLNLVCGINNRRLFSMTVTINAVYQCHLERLMSLENKLYIKSIRGHAVSDLKGFGSNESLDISINRF